MRPYAAALLETGAVLRAESERLRSEWFDLFQDTGVAVEEMRLATGFSVGEGDAFVISYTGDSPIEAQRVTAKLTDLLIAEHALGHRLPVAM